MARVLHSRLGLSRSHADLQTMSISALHDSYVQLLQYKPLGK